MFFPFIDYVTTDFTYSDEVPVVALTTSFRGIYLVEVRSSNANSSQKGVKVTASQTFTDDSATFTLLATGSYTPNEQNYIFLPSGVPIYMERADQFGSATIRIHAFRLP